MSDAIRFRVRHAVIRQESFRVIEGSPKMYARRTNPTKTMECWFCADCNTRLYHMPGGTAYPNRDVKPGTLDDTSWMTPAIRFWTRSAQPWVVIPEDATKYETQPETLAWTSP